ncbi:MAG TPA: helix-turn-helix transcriptional regulator [Solirubrobacteraceae bacterium]|nr:helix-turn-helix transcriptional regulator [Solirubrobacteraceae bacterium]
MHRLVGRTDGPATNVHQTRYRSGGSGAGPGTRRSGRPNGVEPERIGRRVCGERLRRQMGGCELARRVGVSASLISQVEPGKASPSVGTLYAIVNEFGLSRRAAPRLRAGRGHLVRRRAPRRFQDGAQSERLTGRPAGAQ